MSRTAMLITPSLEEIELAAAKIGLPPIEAKKFFYHYESNGWKVGRVKMVSLSGALAGWKIRWQERSEQQNSGHGGNGKKHWAEQEIDQMNRLLNGK